MFRKCQGARPEARFPAKDSLPSNICRTSRERVCFTSRTNLRRLLCQVLLSFVFGSSPGFLCRACTMFPLSLPLLEKLQATRVGSRTGTLLFSGLLCALCPPSFKLVTLRPILLVSSQTPNARRYNRHHSADAPEQVQWLLNFSTFPRQNNFYSNVRTNW